MKRQSGKKGAFEPGGFAIKSKKGKGKNKGNTGNESVSTVPVLATEKEVRPNTPQSAGALADSLFGTPLPKPPSPESPIVAAPKGKWSKKPDIKKDDDFVLPGRV